jgi:hypothetical protein
MLLKKAKIDRSKFLPLRPSKPVFRNLTHHSELMKAAGWKSDCLYVPLHHFRTTAPVPSVKEATNATARIISLKAYVIAGCFTVITAADLAHGQPKKPIATEDILVAKITCQDFQKHSDGQWTSSLNARIGKLDFSTHTFGVGEVEIGGADLATVLNQKCVTKKRPQPG